MAAKNEEREKQKSDMKCSGMEWLIIINCQLPLKKGFWLLGMALSLSCCLGHCWLDRRVLEPHSHKGYTVQWLDSPVLILFGTKGVSMMRCRSLPTTLLAVPYLFYLNWTSADTPVIYNESENEVQRLGITRHKHFYHPFILCKETAHFGSEWRHKLSMFLKRNRPE
jgi:hypothetical protein